MPDQLRRQIPGNIPDGVIRNQFLDLSALVDRIDANELFECSLRGNATEKYGELGPNLISCNLDRVTFRNGVSHFDAKDTIFVRVEISGRFDRNFIAQCSFREVVFTQSTLRDTVFVDSLFENVDFLDCDFSVSTFKGNTFRSCRFERCKTTNKLFEHCLFFHCSFKEIRLQEGSILQNFGIRLDQSSAMTFYRAETKEDLQAEQLEPKNQLERVSLEYFMGGDLNKSESLLGTVQFKLTDASISNLLHLLTGIKQLSSFISFLYEEGQLRFFFVIQLFWSLDLAIEFYRGSGIPVNILETLEFASARLRRHYDDLGLMLVPQDRYFLLIREGVTEADLARLIADLNLNIEITSFRRYNSPSIAEIASSENLDIVLFIVLIFSSRFRVEIDYYQDGRKLLDVGMKLIGDGKGGRSAYQALVALNVPQLLYMRLTANVSLSILNRIREVIIEVLSTDKEGPDK